MIRTSTEPTSAWGELSQPVRTEPPAAPYPWRDNAYLAFWAPTAAVFGVFHASTSPNGGGRRTRFSVTSPGGTAELIEPLPAGTLSGAAIHFDLDETVSVDDASLSAELRIVPRHRPADYTPGEVIPPLVAGEPLHHHQQGAVVTGWVEVGGRRTAIDGFGLRDRTWGYRSENAQLLEYVALAGSFDDFTLTAMKFRGPDGRDRTEGFVLTDSETTGVTSMSIRRDASGLFAGARLGLAGGDVLDVEGVERRAGFWAPMGDPTEGPALSAYDEFLAFATSSGAGHGVVEQGIVRTLV